MNGIPLSRVCSGTDPRERRMTRKTGHPQQRRALLKSSSSVTSPYKINETVSITPHSNKKKVKFNLFGCSFFGVVFYCKMEKSFYDCGGFTPVVRHAVRQGQQRRC
jgi:hypothetical protein